LQDFQKLNEADRERFADAVESSFDVVSRQQFFVWTQSAVQALVPHEILVCGVEDGSRRGMAVHRFSASRYFGNEQFELLTDPLTGLLARLMDASGSARGSVVLAPTVPPKTADAELNALIEQAELKNLAAHLMTGARGSLDAFYAFSRISVALDARVAYALELLVPHVHCAFLRVLASERGVASATSQRASRLVTERQAQILNLIKLGKTNSEIALVLHCSPWTIKNHIHAILRKLDSNTRTHAIARAMSLGILQPD